MIIRLLFILAQVPSFMRGLNILKLIVIVREKITSGDIKTEFVNLNDQLVDIFTKSLRGSS